MGQRAKILTTRPLLLPPEHAQLQMLSTERAHPLESLSTSLQWARLTAQICTLLQHRAHLNGFNYGCCSQNLTCLPLRQEELGEYACAKEAPPQPLQRCF